jgi:hypothetical protein
MLATFGLYVVEALTFTVEPERIVMIAAEEELQYAGLGGNTPVTTETIRAIEITATTVIAPSGFANPLKNLRLTGLFLV